MKLLINMELLGNKNVTCSKSNNYNNIYTNSKQPKYDTQNIYEEVILTRAKPVKNVNEGIINNIATDSLAVNKTQTEDMRWERRRKYLCSAVTVGAGVSLIVWIAAAIVWGRNDDTSQNGGNPEQAGPIFSATGFTAWAQAPIYYGKDEVIRFTGVLQNENGLYSSDTGRFSCNVSGLYYIAVTLKRMTDALSIQVYKGEKAILNAESRNRSKNSRNHGISISNSMLVQCLSGEYLILRSDKPGFVYGEARVPHSTFTAFLMHATDTSVRIYETFVGFTAAKKSDQGISGDTMLIKFPLVVVNKGSCYDRHKNRFLCPFSGLYYVSVALKKYNILHVHASQSSQPFLHLVDNGKKNAFSTVSNAAIIRCQRNEVIRMEGMGMGIINNGYKKMENTFTAMLLHGDADGHDNSSFIGFSMYKKSTQNYTLSQTISFDGELMNEGDYFQLKLNHFICPVNAVYYISLNAKKNGNDTLLIDVKLQTDTIFRVESTEIENPAIVMSNSALVRCLPGQMIHVPGAGTGSVYGNSSERHTTFTVFIVNRYRMP